ncbi:MAG: DNA mismatch repair protein [Lachnospiraceae bacterium]|nr:DNA mismatch repair protein [Lachnospiraceae bacterium]
MQELSLLYPGTAVPEYRILPENTAHDLAVDDFCSLLSEMEPERQIIRSILTQISDDPAVIRYRCDIFEDVLHFPQIREQMQKLLGRVDFLKNYGSFRREADASDASSVWELVHRLDEMDEYIQCVQAIYTCLNQVEIRSEGFLALKEYVRTLYEDAGFAELKKDIDALKVDTSKVKSITLGVNLNERYEPSEVGIVSINNRYFTKSGLIGNFCDFLNRSDEIQNGNEWKEQYTFRTAGRDGEGTEKMERTAVMMTSGIQRMALYGIAGVQDDHQSRDVTHMLDRAMTSMLTRIVKKLKRELSRHVSVSTGTMSALLPELIYYIRWAEYVEKLQAKGFVLCKPQVLAADTGEMYASGLYNMKLAQSFMEKNEDSKGIVGNDLDFCSEHRLYILTGANRGGKTTITQAVGIAFLLAQGGIYVPAQSFAFSPADNIFTHYPADENQTMDLGRLGEESRRFREIFIQSTPKSLLLLNESFSTTSFEEGFYIARDVIRILLKLGVRTIFNTHMHKLAMEVDRLNEESSENKAASLVSKTEAGKRSYRIEIAPPEGLSYARDIAEKYGVTYEMLEQEKYGRR